MVTNRHTHADIKNADVRRLLATDLMALRSAMRRVDCRMDTDWVQGIRVGLDTMARRMDLYVRLGTGKEF
jgi:hypothetical protein